MASDNGLNDKEIRDVVWGFLSRYWGISGNANISWLHNSVIGSDYPGGNNEITTTSTGDRSNYNAGSNDCVYFGGGGNDKVEAGGGNDLILGDMSLRQSAHPEAYWGYYVAGLVSYVRGTPEYEAALKYDVLAGHYGNMGFFHLTGWDQIWSWNDAQWWKDGYMQISVGDDTLRGGAGNDSIYGFGGQDSLFGGAGNDLLDAGTGHDVLHGGSGSDTLYGGEGDDTLYGYYKAGSEEDNDLAADGVNVLYGGDGNDKLYAGSSGSDALYGGAGDDELHSGDFGAYMDGGEGNILAGGAGHDRYLMYKGCGWNSVYEFGGEGYDDVRFVNYGMSEVTFDKIGNDLFIYDDTASDVMQFKDWFVNFEIERFTFEGTGLLW